MEPQRNNQNLSEIATLWTVVCRAHSGPSQGGGAEYALEARRQLFDRYSGAIRRYLTAALRDPDGADELFQEFALQFVRGDFHRASPERGRFRDYVKTSLYRMVVNHFRRLRKKPGHLPTEFPDRPAEMADLAITLNNADAEFAQSWKDELLARAWAALERVQHETGQPYYSILRFRAEHAELSSSEMASQLTEQLGRPLNAAGVRQSLHRARDRFADLLLEEVAHSLNSPSIDNIEQELIDLELLEYCRPALNRRKNHGGQNH